MKRRTPAELHVMHTWLVPESQPWRFVEHMHHNAVTAVSAFCFSQCCPTLPRRINDQQRSQMFRAFRPVGDERNSENVRGIHTCDGPASARANYCPRLHAKQPQPDCA